MALPRAEITDVLSLLLVLSVTTSSPILLANILVRSPIPIPTGLFDLHSQPPSVVMRSPSPVETLTVGASQYKRSGSITVVEGRRSGDIWISKGDAVDGKGKIARAIGLMPPVPRLAVLPIADKEEQGEEPATPPLPMQEHSFPSTIPLPSMDSDGFDRSRKESKASSQFSGAEDAYTSSIMIAQRHYSALATTLHLAASPERQEPSDQVMSIATGVAVEPVVATGTTCHLRSRSTSSSVIGQAITTSEISPPPSDPLPPTPLNIRSAKLAKELMHRKSYSSGFSFGAVVNDDVKEIDALTAGVLPLLVPGLKVGEDMKITEWLSPSSSTVTKKSALMGSNLGLLVEDFSSPQLHSTPAQTHRRGKKSSIHKKKHMSLPR